VATARTALCKRQFDLVISDYQLEDGPADGLIAWMCTQGAAPPVLLMTATPELPSAVTQAPVVRRVIAKPAAPETLLGWVEQFIPRDLPRVVFPRLVGTAERSLLLEDSPAWNGIPG
jgi:DNA-binding NtrC family response regulator